MHSNDHCSICMLKSLVAGLLFALILSGCTGGMAPLVKKVSHADEITPEAALVYYQGLAKMTPAELGRERMILVAVQQIPYTQIRMAMLLGHPRVQQDLGKGLSLLDSILKSNDPAAVPFHPLARQVADNYLERIKLEYQLEKQVQQLNSQLKESQRKAAELQDKLDSLANIERTLIPRPRAVRPEGVKR